MGHDAETVNQLIEIIEGSGCSYENYSGRSMNGRECIGISTDSVNDVIADLIDATCGDLALVETLANAIRGMRTDSMGRGTIMYFPKYQDVSR